MSTNLRFRQIHLDFHTGDHVPGIGSAFDPNEFGDTLAAAHVNSITCFSRCHHGWIYHETAKFPERKHPHLTCNLLAEQIEACHARDIRVPIYITVQWDHYTSRQHPEWLVLDENGCHPGTRPFDAGFYCRFCLNTPYVDFLAEQTAEVCDTLPTDGIFFDIVSPMSCSCQYCKDGMESEGMDAADAAQRAVYGDLVLQRFEKRMFEVVKSRAPEATVFFNSGHVGPHHRKVIDSFTHLELESLPSGGWGYMHFPVAQRFARGLGLDTMGMTGKFHTSWGDFSSFKNPEALEFECLNMIALGAKCSVGDQLHPTGKICQETYKLIGGAYAKVEAAEPWCEDVKPVADIGVLTPEEFFGGGHGAMRPAIIGASRILQELRQQFDIIDTTSDFSLYRVLVLPDEIQVDTDLAGKLSAFIAAGGTLIASHKSGLNPAGEAFSLSELGIKYVGDAEFSPDFILTEKLGGTRPDTGQVMYTKGLQVEPLPGTEVLSSMLKPYFNRTWEHFCSHRHTPAEGPVSYPGATRSGNCVYFMHPLFALYEAKAPKWCKELIAGALGLLLPEPSLKVGGPSTLLASVNEQPGKNRSVVHLLHYIAERRAREFDIIEDIIPLYDLPVSLKAEGVSKVTLEPQGQELAFEVKGGRVEVTVPKLEGHQMVVFQK
ncbi:MAG: beta-galactosidase trimerization domain-containing protein [Armatimonadia bacterium]